MARILVVDDEPRNRSLIRAMLKDHDVVEAGTAVEATTQIAANDIDLVILDVLMPGESGIAALPRLKVQTAGRGFVPILVVTALGEQEDKNAALRAGADDVLSKPVDRHELRLRVSSFLRLRAQEQTIRQQRRDLERAIALKDDLFGLLVHDLRNPLTSVIAMLQVLRDSADNKDAIDDAEAGLVAARRVGGVVEDILQLIALEAGQIQLLRSTFSLADVVAAAASSLRGSARLKNVAIEITGDVVVEADSGLVRRALENLLANALRYAPADSVIGVEIVDVDEADHVVVAINDRGPGVPDAIKSELFTRFGGVRRETSGSAERRSYGFGLYLVDLVARAH
ncbi:MAG TPA: response regulator, partial [Myxococcota bacterium]